MLSPDELREGLRSLPSLTIRNTAPSLIRMSPDDDIKHFLVTRDVARGETTVVEFGTDHEAVQVARRDLLDPTGESDDVVGEWVPEGLREYDRTTRV
jgi:hypothetical protein